MSWTIVDRHQLVAGIVSAMLLQDGNLSQQERLELYDLIRAVLTFPVLSLEQNRDQIQKRLDRLAISLRDVE